MSEISLCGARARQCFQKTLWRSQLWIEDFWKKNNNKLLFSNSEKRRKRNNCKAYQYLRILETKNFEYVFLAKLTKFPINSWAIWFLLALSPYLRHPWTTREQSCLKISCKNRLKFKWRNEEMEKRERKGKGGRKVEEGKEKEKWKKKAEHTAKAFPLTIANSWSMMAFRFSGLSSRGRACSHNCLVCWMMS